MRQRRRLGESDGEALGGAERDASAECDAFADGLGFCEPDCDVASERSGDADGVKLGARDAESEAVGDSDGYARADAESAGDDNGETDALPRKLARALPDTELHTDGDGERERFTCNRAADRLVVSALARPPRRICPRAVPCDACALPVIRSWQEAKVGCAQRHVGSSFVVCGPP